MAVKKRSVRLSIRKEDEEKINKRIAIGAILTLFFLLFFLFTQISEKEKIPPVAYDALTPIEKIEAVRAIQQEITDRTNYQRAMTLQERMYCDQIKETVLKAECVEKTPEPTLDEPRVEENQAQTSDQTNYQRALTLQNTVYCEMIGDENLKAECFSTLEG